MGDKNLFTIKEKKWYSLYFDKIKTPHKTIEVEIPKGFFNCGVSDCNYFIADTNNSSDWRTLKFPLPKPLGKRWNILRYDNVNKEKTIVELISYGWF